MELFLIYLWLKLDVIIGVLVGPLLLFIPAIIVGVFFRLDNFDDEDTSAKLFRKYHTRLVIYSAGVLALGVLLPSSKETAILVGSHIAIESIKSPEGEKVGKLIRKKANDFLDEQLKEVTKK